MGENAWQKYHCQTIKYSGGILYYKCCVGQTCRTRSIRVPYTNEQLWAKIESEMGGLAPTLTPTPTRPGECPTGYRFDYATGSCKKITRRECNAGETKCIGRDLYWCRDGRWTLQQYGSSKCVKAAPPKKDCIPEGGIDFPFMGKECCSGLVRSQFSGRCVKPTAGSGDNKKPKQPEKCPKGITYGRPFGGQCDPGYHPEFNSLGIATGKCICDAYESGGGQPGLGNISGQLGSIMQYLPMIIVAAIVISILGMFRR